MKPHRIIYVFVLLFLCACNKKAVHKEIVYKNYSATQLRKYLSGYWSETGNKEEQNDKIFHSFQFVSDTAGSFDKLQETEKKDKIIHELYSCPPAFRIIKFGPDFHIKLVYMLGEKYDYKIKSISNNSLVLSNGNTTETYSKREFSK